MQNIILITPVVLDLHELARSYEQVGKVSVIEHCRLTVEGDWGRFAFDLEDGAKLGFEEDELAEVLHAMPTAQFAQLTYLNVDAVNIALQAKSIPEGSVVDNDHGLRAPITEIRRRIAGAVDWLNSAI